MGRHGSDGDAVREYVRDCVPCVRRDRERLIRAVRDGDVPRRRDGPARSGRRHNDPFRCEDGLRVPVRAHRQRRRRRGARDVAAPSDEQASGVRRSGQRHARPRDVAPTVAGRAYRIPCRVDGRAPRPLDVNGQDLFLPVFVRADVGRDVAADAALVVADDDAYRPARFPGKGRPRIDRGAARTQREGPGRAAVPRKGPEERVGGDDHRRRITLARNILALDDAVRHDGVRVIVIDLAARISPEDAVFHQRTFAAVVVVRLVVVQPAAGIGRVAREGAEQEEQSVGVVEDSAAFRRGVAREGAVPHRRVTRRAPRSPFRRHTRPCCRRTCSPSPPGTRRRRTSRRRGKSPCCRKRRSATPAGRCR